MASSLMQRKPHSSNTTFEEFKQGFINTIKTVHNYDLSDNGILQTYGSVAMTFQLFADCMVEYLEIADFSSYIKPFVLLKNLFSEQNKSVKGRVGCLSARVSRISHGHVYLDEPEESAAKDLYIGEAEQGRMKLMLPPDDGFFLDYGCSTKTYMGMTAVEIKENDNGFWKNDGLVYFLQPYMRYSESFDKSLRPSPECLALKQTLWKWYGKTQDGKKVGCMDASFALTNPDGPHLYGFGNHFYPNGGNAKMRSVFKLGKCTIGRYDEQFFNDFGCMGGSYPMAPAGNEETKMPQCSNRTGPNLNIRRTGSQLNTEERERRSVFLAAANNLEILLSPEIVDQLWDPDGEIALKSQKGCMQAEIAEDSGYYYFRTSKCEVNIGKDFGVRGTPFALRFQCKNEKYLGEMPLRQNLDTGSKKRL